MMTGLQKDHAIEGKKTMMQRLQREMDAMASEFSEILMVRSYGRVQFLSSRQESSRCPPYRPGGIAPLVECLLTTLQEIADKMTASITVSHSTWENEKGKLPLINRLQDFSLMDPPAL